MLLCESGGAVLSPARRCGTSGRCSSDASPLSLLFLWLRMLENQQRVQLTFPRHRWHGTEKRKQELTLVHFSA